MRIFEIASVVGFFGSALFVAVVSMHERRRVAELQNLWSDFFTHSLLDYSHHLSGLEDEEAVVKLGKILEEIDQEWHHQHKELIRPRKAEVLASYLGNVGTHASRI